MGRPRLRGPQRRAHHACTSYHTSVRIIIINPPRSRIILRAMGTARRPRGGGGSARPGNEAKLILLSLCVLVFVFVFVFCLFVIYLFLFAFVLFLFFLYSYNYNVMP